MGSEEVARYGQNGAFGTNQHSVPSGIVIRVLMK
jgi:hypothetical protein